MVLNRKKSENMASITHKHKHTPIKVVVSASKMFVNDKITQSPYRLVLLLFLRMPEIILIAAQNLVTVGASLNSIFVDRCPEFNNHNVSDYNIDLQRTLAHTSQNGLLKQTKIKYAKRPIQHVF